RYCYENVARLIEEAKSKKIDLSNTYALKIVGAGFLETSGFYTRKTVNEREMLGYFHYILIADNHVFDFDLYEPIVLPFEDYVRLQFTPPTLPYFVFGINFIPSKELKYWNISQYDTNNYISSSPKPLWSKTMGEIIDLEKLMTKKRAR
nr:hypothetical protein [Bdellovibrionales bacterium]